MPHDPALLAETRAWLMKSSQDLKAAEVLFHADPALKPIGAHHAQQAAEKSLKAFLEWHRRKFQKTHDLAKLGRQCVEIDPSLGTICGRCAPLSEFAVQHRYPSGWSEPTLDEAREALRLARELFDAILARLPSAVRP